MNMILGPSTYVRLFLGNEQISTYILNAVHTHGKDSHHVIIVVA